METEELLKTQENCNENKEKQHSTTVNEQKNQLTSADIDATDQQMRGQQRGHTMEQKETTTIIESANDGDKSTIVEVVNNSDNNNILCAENSKQIPANTEENLQKSIIETSLPNVNINTLVSTESTVEEGKEMVTKTTTQENVSNTQTLNNSPDKAAGEGGEKTIPTNNSSTSSVNNSPSVRYSDLAEKHQYQEEVFTEQQIMNDKVQHEECDLKLQQQMLHYEQQMEQLKAALQQKDNMINLFQRENAILEKEKEAVS